MTPRSSLLGRVVRAPALHFLVLGAMLFALRGVAESRSGLFSRLHRRAPVVITQAQVARVSAEHPPALVDRMIDGLVDDEILYREALAMGLDRNDPTIRRRLVEKMRFLEEAAEGENEQALFERALALGLNRADPVVRGVLIGKLEMIIRAAADPPQPTEAELRAYYERHAGEFEDPVSITLEHVFFSADLRGERAADDANAVLERLRLRGDEHLNRAVALGDPFLDGHRMAGQTAASLRKRFGSELAVAVEGLPEGSWHGPVRSAYGFHLVRIGDRRGGGRLPMADVRERIAGELAEQARRAALRAKLAALREIYPINVPPR